jgi:nicotinate dehydrogenase subunit A
MAVQDPVVEHPEPPQDFTLEVNGRTHAVRAEPHAPLLYILRNDLGLNGPRFGCGLGQCGACAVLLDGSAVLSCVTPLVEAAGRPIVTLEGLGTPDAPHPLQRAFLEEQAVQCAYCANGMIVVAKAFLDRRPAPTEEDVRQALADNLCRCGSHQRIVRAVLRAAREMASP